MKRTPDTRPIARPKDVLDVCDYRDEKTHIEGHSVSIITKDNCWPGIFAPNPFQPPFSPHAYIVSFEWRHGWTEIEMKYVFPSIVRKYMFPKLKLFRRDVKQDSFKLATDFRQEMLKQAESCLSL